ncbi:hypothetical protein BH23THE1_BH23THE1_19020 [soil metagenome]
MSRMFSNSNYVLATVATISFILLFSTITNPLFGYDLDDVKSSFEYQEALDEFDLPPNTKNFSMELDNGLIANYYLAPNQTYVFDGVSGAITEQNGNDDNDDNDGDGKNKIKYYVDVTVTTTYSYPQSQDKPQDPRNDPKYDSIDWQDDNEEDNLTIEEMDKILEERENNEEDNRNSNSNDGSSEDDSSSSSSDSGGGSDSGGSEN